MIAVAASRRAPNHMVRRRSGLGIVHARVDVKIWVRDFPSVAAVRPAHCSCCGAASCPYGQPIVLRGHGIRQRQVRGPLEATREPEVLVIAVRRYRCVRCGGITTVFPRGVARRQYYSASAIGLALLHFGHQMAPMRQIRQRVSPWRVSFESPSQWSSLSRWLKAIEAGQLFEQVRPAAPGSPARLRAERAASMLLSLAPAALAGASLDEQVFAGAALAA